MSESKEERGGDWVEEECTKCGSVIEPEEAREHDGMCANCYFGLEEDLEEAG